MIKPLPQPPPDVSRIFSVLLSTMPNVIAATTSSSSKPGQWTPPGAIYPRHVTAPENWDEAIERARATLALGNADWVICPGELHLHGSNLLEVEAATLALLELVNPAGGYLIVQVSTAAAPEEADTDEGAIFTPWEWWRRRIQATAEAYRFSLDWEWRAMLEFQVLKARATSLEETEAFAPWLADQVLIARVEKLPEQLKPKQRKWWWPR